MKKKLLFTGGGGVLNKSYTQGRDNTGYNSSFDTYTSLGGGGDGIRDTSASTTYTGGGEGGYNGGGNTGASGYDGGEGFVGGGNNYGAGGGGGSGGVGQDNSGDNGGDMRKVHFFLIVGGLYSVTAWRENDQEGHSVY